MPPSVAETIRSFGSPVLALAPQPRLEEFAAAPILVGGRMVELSLSYSVLRHPLRRDHPENLVPLSAEQERAIQRAESGDLPSWIVEQITRMRYPVLWEAVRTSVSIPSERARPIEARLAAHVNDALRLMPGANTRGRRVARLSESDLVRGASIEVDGVPTRGIALRDDPDVVAFGLRVDDRHVTAVLDRALAPLVNISLTRR